MSLQIQVLGEDLGILIHAAVLDDRGGMLCQVVVGAQAVRQEEDLRMERPGIHVRIEIGQVGILGHRLEERLPAQAHTQQLHQGGFPHANIASHSHKLFHLSSKDYQ